MYIETVPNRNSRPAILLREGWREGRRTRKRTLANLTDWPAAQVEALRAVLKGDYQRLAPTSSFTIERTRPHGHVAAGLGTIRQLRLEPLLATKRCPERDAVVAMIAARILQPRSKLAIARELRAATLTSTLGELLELNDGDEELLYRAMDWLLPHQPQNEPWRSATCRTVRWHCTTSARLTSKVAAVRWRATAIAAMANATNCRLLSGC